MASSGWQGNKDFPFSSSDLKCNLYIDSITHTGNSLRVKGKVGALCVNNGSGWYAWYDYPVYVTPEGGSQQTLLTGGERVYGDGNGGYTTAKTVSFDTTVTASATSTSYNYGVYITMNNGQNTGTLRWNLTFPSSGTAPTDLNVTSISPVETTISATVSVSGWGGLGDSNSRYRELQVWEGNMTGDYRKQKATGDTLSSTITCNNSSTGTLSIIGNKKYYIGGYATNGTLDTGSQSFGTTITRPPMAMGSVGTVTKNSAVINWSIANQGGEKNIKVDYSLNGGTTWNDITTITTSGAKNGSITITGLLPNKAYQCTLRSAAIGGQTVGGQVLNFTTPDVAAKVYCSINNVAKREKKGYCSVGGVAKRIKKVYCSVNGVAKLGYEDPNL